jgi:predicted RND superfamily exporter protein
VERFVAWLREQQGVMAVRSLPDFIKGVGRSFGAEGDALPSDATQVEQLLLSYQFSAPPGDRAMGLVNDAYSSSLVHVSVRNGTGEEYQGLDRRAQAWLKRNLPELNVYPGTSAVMMFSKMAHENIPPMVIGALSVLAVAGLIVCIGLRSLRLGLIALIPALLPAGLAFGVWGLISGHFGIALSVVTDASLGIIVDDCIHVLGRYHSARKRGAATAEACQYTISHVGGAITTTTLVLSVGVGLLAFSSVQPTHEMGVVMPIIFVFAWFSTLVLLPQILMRLDR